MIEICIPRITFGFRGLAKFNNNGDPRGKIFLSCPQTKNRLFLLLTTDFVLLLFFFFGGGGKISFCKSLNTLSCDST